MIMRININTSPILSSSAIICPILSASFFVMLKKIFFQIHWFLGITAGLILSIMGVTGALYSYESQILKWINQDSYVVQVQNTAPLSPAEIYQRYSAAHPEAQINSITVAKDPSAAASINVAKEGERRGQTQMLNPYDASVLPDIQGKEVFRFIEQLHRNLTVGLWANKLLALVL